MDMTLVVMAAGLGSRYGGVKQIERLGPDGLIRDMSGEGEGIVLDPEALVSMNLWGYHPQMLDVMAQYFDDFVHTLTPGDEKRECLLPVMMDALTAQSRVLSLIHI